MYTEHEIVKYTIMAIIGWRSESQKRDEKLIHNKQWPYTTSLVTQHFPYILLLGYTSLVT